MQKLILLAFIHSAAFCQKVAPPRWFHTSTILGKNLYVLGGYTNGGGYADSFLSLDLSTNFGLEAPPFKALSNSAPLVARHAAAAQQDQIFYYGGTSPDMVNNQTTIFMSDTESFMSPEPSTWPNGNRRVDASFATYPAYDSLLFGGYSLNATTNLNTTNNSSVVASFLLHSLSPGDKQLSYRPYNDQWPTGRYSHQAVMLDIGAMIVLGGIDAGELMIPMEEVTVYVSETGKWETRWATPAGGSANIPRPRRNFVAVAVGTRVFIHGGTDLEMKEYYNDIAVLETKNWTWTVYSPQNPIPGRYGHQANLIGNKRRTADGGDNQIFLFDIEAMDFAKIYEPVFMQSSSSFNAKSFSLSPVTVAVIIVGGIVMTVTLAFAAVMVIRARYIRKRQQNVWGPIATEQLQTPPPVFDRSVRPPPIITSGFRERAMSRREPSRHMQPTVSVIHEEPSGEDVLVSGSTSNTLTERSNRKEGQS